MSTATTASAPLNGAATPSNPNSAASTPSAGRAQLKATSRSADTVRKQAGSPVDGTQRKAPAQRAWTQGTNPITQRLNSNTANGAMISPKPASSPAGGSRETQSPSKHLHDRLLFLFAHMTGLSGSITLKNGEQYTGILSGASVEPGEQRYVFKMVKRLQPASGQVNGAAETYDEYIGVGEDHKMSFDIIDVADLSVPDVQLNKAQAKPPNGATAGFRTDAEISGNFAARERMLQRWEPAADTAVDLSLDAGGQGWDQFEANERLYGLKSTYNEELYTTKIDTTHPEYVKRAAMAAKIEREIESEKATNLHVAEERGQLLPDDSGINEEDKYSGVVRDSSAMLAGQPSKYTPPAKRAPTGQATVPGAPVDPAIISSQIARPGSSANKSGVAAAAAPPVEKQVASKAQETVSPPTTEQKSAASKVVAESNQKLNAALKPNASNAVPPPVRRPGRPDNATANVEHDLLDAFKQFNANEKLRVQERQRTLQRQDKAVKLNDLKKFSQNFKLHTPVPQDLIPILAKDENKQRDIVEKALRNVQELKASPAKPATSAAPEPKARAAQVTSPPAQADRQSNQRHRGPPNFQSMRHERPFSNQSVNHMPPRPAGPGHLSQRLNITSQQHKAGASHVNIPQPLPIHEPRMPPTGPASSSTGSHTPTSSVSTRFNVKAMEFRPNPAAHTFTPTGNPSAGSSPRVDSAPRPEPRKIPTVSFFGSQKPARAADKKAFEEAFNPIKRMKEEVKKEEEPHPSVIVNGGIPPAFRTPPTWTVPEANVDKRYIDMFAPSVVPTQPISAPHTLVAGGPIPHQHQLPPHLQNPPHMPQHTPHHTPRHPAAQPHHGPNGPHHMEGHQMQFSASTNGMHPSPRPMPPQYIYQPSGQPLVYPQPMPAGYGMSPGMHHAAIRPPAGGQFVNVQAPQMGGHMMTSQPSNGPYMNMPMNPQQMMYSPAPGQMYHHAQLPPPPGPNGYPSPRPHVAHMMSHQGSQQGQQPQYVYVPPGGQVPVFAMQQGSIAPMRMPYAQPHQPPFGNSPHQPHVYPHPPHRGTPNATYSQPMMPAHSIPPQAVPPPAGPAHVPEEGAEVK